MSEHPPEYWIVVPVVVGIVAMMVAGSVPYVYAAHVVSVYGLTAVGTVVAGVGMFAFGFSLGFLVAKERGDPR